MNAESKKRKYELTTCKTQRIDAFKFVDLNHMLTTFLPLEMVKTIWGYYDSRLWQFQKDLLKVKKLVNEECSRGMERFVFNAFEGKDTRMAEFVDGLIKEDIHDFANQLENFMQVQERLLLEMRERRARSAEEHKTELAKQQATVPDRNRLENMTVKELKNLIRYQKYPLTSQGRKADIIDRLVAFQNRFIVE